MKQPWRYIKSFLREEVLEQGHSQFSPGLQVWYAYGRTMLNAANVNYSFGKLDAVFRSAFRQIKVAERVLDNVLLLGLGAGNVPTILHGYHPQARVVAVEIDPEVLRLGAAHFGLRSGPQMEIVLADATEYIHACEDVFDMVVVDLFIDDQVPEAACTEAFLHRVVALLADGGVLVFNRLGHSATLLQQTEAFGRKMMAALPGTRILDADSNKVMVYEKR